jgi:hypothetical protein
MYVLTITQIDSELQVKRIKLASFEPTTFENRDSSTTRPYVCTYSKRQHVPEGAKKPDSLKNPTVRIKHPSHT